MLLQHIIEKIERLPSGAIISEENKWDRGFIISIINTFSRDVIRQKYQKNKRINPICYQKYYPAYSVDMQESNKIPVYFSCPETISMDSMSDGIRYIGSIDCSENFRRIKTRAELSSYSQHKVMSPRAGRFISALYDGSAQLIEIYGNPLIEELLVEMVAANPLEIPTYNQYTDNYPFPDEDIPLMEQLIWQAQTGIMGSITPDYVSNGVDRNQNGPVKNR